MGGMDLKDIKRYQRNFEKARTEFKDWLANFLIKEGYKVIVLTKGLTPVDTGTLRANWTLGDQLIKKVIDKQGKVSSEIEQEATIRSLKNDGNTYYVVIYNSTDYASFVEYGTSKMIARYMLTRSLNKIRNELPFRFNTEFEAFMKSLGGA